MIEIIIFNVLGFICIFVPIFFNKGWANKVAGIFFLLFMLLFSNIYLTVVYQTDILSTIQEYYDERRAMDSGF